MDVSPSRTGKGERWPRCWDTLLFMNFDAILEQATAFSSEGIGKVITDFAKVIYGILFPANSDSATPVPIG